MSTIGILGLVYGAGICTGMVLTVFIIKWIKQTKWSYIIIGNNT